MCPEHLYCGCVRRDVAHNQHLESCDMNVTLPRSDQPGWKAEVKSWSTDHEGSVWVICPNGHAARIRGHSMTSPWDIASDGRVTPSIFCQTPMQNGQICNWHVFATLEGWTG